MSAPITGTCICGAIVLTIAAGAAPVKLMSCYCSDCQKNAGGPLQTNALFAAADVSLADPLGVLTVFSITEGTASGLPKGKAFCGRCGCTFYTQPGHHNGAMVVVKTGILDNNGYVARRARRVRRR